MNFMMRYLFLQIITKADKNKITEHLVCYANVINFVNMISNLKQRSTQKENTQRRKNNVLQE